MDDQTRDGLIGSVVHLRRLNVMFEQLSIHLVYSKKEDVDWLINDIKETHRKYLESFKLLKGFINEP